MIAAMLRSVSVTFEVGRYGIDMWIARLAACSPERRPKISVSSSEFAPRRLPPCTETHATSPAAYSPGIVVWPSNVGLDPAHDVVLSRLDVDRLAGDVRAGEVTTDVHDLPECLERAPTRHLGDIERRRCHRGIPGPR